MKRVRGRTEGGRGIKDITRKPTESTNLIPWKFTETELPTKELPWDRLRPPTHL